jgi:hypothetical protein
MLTFLCILTDALRANIHAACSLIAFKPIKTLFKPKANLLSDFHGQLVFNITFCLITQKQTKCLSPLI